MLDAHMQFIDPPRDCPAADGFRTPHALRCIFLKVARKLGNRDAMIAREIERRFIVNVPAIVFPLPCKPKIEDVVCGSIGNMPTRGARPWFQERVRRHLKSHALVILSEGGKDLVTPADLDHL